MKLIKGNRETKWVPLDATMPRQVRTGKRGVQYVLVEFAGTKQEQVMAKRLGQRFPWHQSWVRLSSLMEHAK